MSLGKIKLSLVTRIHRKRIFFLKAGSLCIVTLLSLCCLTVSRIEFDEDRQTAVRETDNFHRLFNEQRFEDIYELTDKRASETKSKQGLISILSGLRNERGSASKSEVIDAKIEVRASYREIHLVFRTKFENGESIEKFTWYVSNDKASLFSYETE
jgi:hypothetical protein